MTTVLVKQKTLELATAEIQEYLRRRGVEVSGFGPTDWLADWLNDSAGSFWGRKIKVPVVGDVCRAKVESCEKKDGIWFSKGRIAETRCWIKGAERLDNEAKVKVVATTESGVECVVANAVDKLSSPESFAYRIYYTARGVTGVLEEVPWRQGGVRLARIVLNENLPASVLAGFERIAVPDLIRQQFEVYLVSTSREEGSGYQFVTMCDNCDGAGAVECSRCVGTGRYRSTCRKCGGSGLWENGGECYACHGTGHFDSACNACNGTGRQECWACRGDGVRLVSWDPDAGHFWRMGKDKQRIMVPNIAVFLWRKADGRRVKVTGNWHEIVRRVRTTVDESVLRSERSAALQAEARKIINGLETKIAHSDTTRLPPVHAVLLGASLKRAHGRVIYQLKECGESAWEKSRNEPYPADTLLKIKGIDLPKGESIVYLGYYNDRILEVSFPRQIDVGTLKDRELEISSAGMKPPEVRQKDYLERWIEATDSPIYRAMVDGCNTKPAEIESYFNKRIEQYERQRAAVGYGLSEAPLFLLKGPPGTGKTTIIVEIIRQAIHRGQRVLLTSQTHKAVENVLKKLHSIVESGEDKIIRMVHYTAQEWKSSELAKLAKLYKDGAGTDEVKLIKSYVAGYRSELGDNVSRHGESAVALLRQYCEEGKVCFGRIVKAKADQKSALDRLMSELQQKLAEVDAERAALLARLDSTVGKDIRDGEEKLNSKLHEKSALEEDMAALGMLLQKKRKRVESLTDGSFGAKLMGAFAWLNKNYNADVVRKQIDDAETKLISAGAKKEVLTREIEEVGIVIAGHRQIFEKQKDSIENSILGEKSKVSDDSHDRIEKERVERNAAIAMFIASSEKKIAELNEFIREETRLTVESSEADWTAVCQRVEEEWMREKEVHGFVCGWEKVLVDNPEAVVKYLNSQTNVFMATCVGVGGWRSLMNGTYDRRFEDVQGIKRKQFFDLVIVDEAGHATFAETVIPLSMGKRAILIGDDKQLPPMEDEDLETYSMFTRLWEDRGCDVPRVMLDTQFRMHPEIANFVSDVFYRGEIKNGVTDADRAFQFSSFNRPVCLLSTSRQRNRYEKWWGKKKGFSNELEATYVKEILDELVKHCNSYGAKDEVSVAILTPYARQVALIRSKLKDVFGNSGNVRISQGDVASVDKFQGEEKEVVIASFVRSPRPNVYAPKLTFVQDLKRMNVAFSRPRKMLILVGDIEALSTQLGTEDGRKAFESFHRVVRESGLEILAWERKVSA